MAPTHLVKIFLLVVLPATVKALVPKNLPLTTAATTTTCRPTTALQVDASSVSDVIQGLDSVLGNPANNAAATVAADAVVNSNNLNNVNMQISDTAIMLGGGVATLVVGGLAAFFTTNNDDNSDSGRDKDHELQQSQSRSTELQAQAQNEESPATTTEKSIEEKSVEEPEIVEALEEAFEVSKEEEAKIEALLAAEVTATAKDNTDPTVQESRQRGIFMQRILDKKSQLLEKANKKLRRQTAKLSTAETKVQETQSQLTAVTMSNRKLYADYQAEKATVEAMKEELAQAQNRYVELQQSTEAELKAMREVNLELEDKYELEQNEKKRRTSALRETEWTLDRTSKQFSKTKLELMKVKAALDRTQSQVKASNESLEVLQEEKQSLRKLTGNMWKLSKDRARQRLGKVKGKLSRKNNNEDEQ